MPSFRIVVVTLAVVLIHSPIAAFAADPPIAAPGAVPWTQIEPANGGTIPKNASAQTAIRFDWPNSVSLGLNPFSKESMFFEIATAPTLGLDGTLATEFVVHAGFMSRGDAFPDRYTGAIPVNKANTPGPYYLQYYGAVRSEQACAPDPSCIVQSPVYSFTVVAPPAPAPTSPTDTTSDYPVVKPVADRLTLATALSTSRNRAKSKYRARSPKVKCSRNDESTFECKVTWRSKGKSRTRYWQVYRENGKIKFV